MTEIRKSGCRISEYSTFGLEHGPRESGCLIYHQHFIRMVARIQRKHTLYVVITALSSLLLWVQQLEWLLPGKKVDSTNQDHHLRGCYTIKGYCLLQSTRAIQFLSLEVLSSYVSTSTSLTESSRGARF